MKELIIPIILAIIFISFTVFTFEGRCIAIGGEPIDSLRNAHSK